MVDLSFLDSYQEEFTPQQSNNFPSLDNIPDGSYDCTILSAIITQTKNSQQPIVKCMIQFDALDRKAEKVYFLQNQENVNRLAGDLLTLGFEADKWKKNCKLSEQITNAIGQLPGRRFKGTKKTQIRGEKSYHNLYLNAGLEPAANAAQLVADNAVLQSTNGQGSGEAIPF